jgi:hypothetical protein
MKTKLLLVIFISTFLSFHSFAQHINAIKSILQKDHAKFSTSLKMRKAAVFSNKKILSFTSKRPFIAVYDSIYEWDLDTLLQQYVTVGKYINMVYDSKNNLTSSLYQTWDGIDWVNTSQYALTYDSNNNHIKLVTQSWDGTAWGNADQSIYTYDANDNMTSELYQIWGNMSWENSYQYTYTYDLNNNKIKQLEEDWMNNAWLYEVQNTYSYDSQNNNINEVNQVWQNNSWVNITQSITTYDSQNNLENQLTQDWVNNNWVNNSQQFNTYDSINNHAIELIQNWRMNNWMDTIQNVNSYDINHNLINTVSVAKIDNTWMPNYEYIWTYDANNLETSNSFKQYDSTGISFMYGDSTHFYFYAVAGIKNLKTNAANIKIYPNPSVGKFKVELTNKQPLVTVEIYNLLGEQILQQKLAEVDIMNTPKGIYFVKVYDGKFWYSKKILKQ